MNFAAAIAELQRIDMRCVGLAGPDVPAVLMRTDMTATEIVANVRKLRDAPERVYVFEIQGDWQTTPGVFGGRDAEAWLTQHLGKPR